MEFNSCFRQGMFKIYRSIFAWFFAVFRNVDYISINFFNYTAKPINIIKKMHFDVILLFVIILGFLTTFIQLTALQFVFVAELESLKRGVGIILSLFFGYFVFKEEINLKKILSVFIIVCGVIFVINFTNFTNLQINM